MTTTEWLQWLDVVSRFLAPVVVGLIGWIIKLINKLSSDVDRLDKRMTAAETEKPFLIRENEQAHQDIKGEIKDVRGDMKDQDKESDSMKKKLDIISLQLAVLTKRVPAVDSRVEDA